MDIDFHIGVSKAFSEALEHATGHLLRDYLLLMRYYIRTNAVNGLVPYFPILGV